MSLNHRPWERKFCVLRCISGVDRFRLTLHNQLLGNFRRSWRPVVYQGETGEALMGSICPTLCLFPWSPSLCQTVRIFDFGALCFLSIWKIGMSRSANLGMWFRQELENPKYHLAIVGFCGATPLVVNVRPNKSTSCTLNWHWAMICLRPAFEATGRLL